MSIRKVVTAPNQILSTACSPVVDGEDVSGLIQDLMDTMKGDHGGVRGIGLAANQIGENKRVIVVDVPDFKGSLVNPEVISGKTERVAEEMCLSQPGVKVRVNRFKFIKVRHRDGVEKLEDLAARVVQHEIDHLDGILITDRRER